MPAFNDPWPIQTDNVIDTYCCSIPVALGLSAMVIRRTMMKMLSVFLFSETFSKRVVRYKLLQIQSPELHVHFAFLSTFHVARGILLYT